MGHNDRAIEDLEGFTVDWRAGMKLDDMAAKYHVHPSTVSHTAKTLGLRARQSSNTLKGGQWVVRRGIKKWVSKSV